MVLRVYKFSKLDELEDFLQGAITGGVDLIGGLYLNGKSLTFTSPSNTTVVFASSPASSQVALSFQEIKAQIEAAVAGVVVTMYQKHIRIIEATPSSGIAIATDTTGGHARVVGTVDMNTLAYGAGGDLDTLVLKINVDGAGLSSITFAAPANRGDVVTQINAVVPGVASIDGDNHLVIQSSLTGALSTVVIGDATSTANPVLGFTDNTSVTGATINEANAALGLGARTAKVFGPDPTSPPAIVESYPAAEFGGYVLITVE